MNRIIFGMALAATAFNLGAAQPAPPIPPNWEPVLTRPGALAKGSGHVQRSTRRSTTGCTSSTGTGIC